jgi:hypothetical protein
MMHIDTHLRHRYQAEEAVRRRQEARRQDEEARAKMAVMFGGTQWPTVPRPPRSYARLGARHAPAEIGDSL